jgi:phosphonate transport system substrate-binding protein
MTIKPFFIKHLLVLLIACLPASGAWSKEKVSYTFGVVPQSATIKVARLWGPLLRHIEKNSGIKIVFKTANNMKTFEERVAHGEYDFAYLDPKQYVNFSNGGIYQAIAKRKDQPLKGIIVVHKDSPIQSLEDLQNSMVAFPSPTEFGSTLIPQQALLSNNVNVQPRYVNSDDSVYLGVSRGLFPAGGGIKVTLERMKKKVKKNLRIIWEAPDYTPHAIAVHNRVPQNVVDVVQEAFVKLNEDRNCSIQLKKLKIMEGLELAEDKDWNDVREFKGSEL